MSVCSFHSYCDSVFPCGCKFSLVAAIVLLWLQLFSCGCEFSTCTCLRHDEDLVAKRGRVTREEDGSEPGTFELWQRVFNVLIRQETRCPFVAIKRHRNRDVSPDWVWPVRAENIPPILLRRLFQREVLATGKRAPKLQKPNLHPSHEPAAGHGWEAFATLAQAA